MRRRVRCEIVHFYYLSTHHIVSSRRQQDRNIVTDIADLHYKSTHHIFQAIRPVATHHNSLKDSTSLIAKYEVILDTTFYTLRRLSQNYTTFVNFHNDCQSRANNIN